MLRSASMSYNRLLNQHQDIRAWIYNYIHVKQWNVTHPIFNSSVKLLFKLGHGWVITLHQNIDVINYPYHNVGYSARERDPWWFGAEWWMLENLTYCNRQPCQECKFLLIGGHIKFLTSSDFFWLSTIIGYITAKHYSFHDTSCMKSAPKKEYTWANTT